MAMFITRSGGFSVPRNRRVRFQKLKALLRKEDRKSIGIETNRSKSTAEECGNRKLSGDWGRNSPTLGLSPLSDRAWTFERPDEMDIL
jgi:hypothetical protein